MLANAASYGIYAEMHRKESENKIKVTCHGIDKEPFHPYISHPDEPGEYCFPPLASLITGAARLMLSLLEHSVHRLGGTYAMEDTDSMAIVATERGGLIPCPGGRAGKKPNMVKALSWAEVSRISDDFLTLKPYSPGAIKGSILKVEKDNRDPVSQNPRQLYCVAISAKRYALFLKGNNGEPVLLRASCPNCGRKNKPNAVRCKNPGCNKSVRPNNEDDRWSEHGLGHLLNPTDPESEDREWVAQVWMNIIRRALSLPTSSPEFEARPVVGRTSVSSAALMRPLTKLNDGKKYADQIKPFNFLLTCHVKPLGHPIGCDPERFHLITPYETDPGQWLKKDWIDQYSKIRYRITTDTPYGTRTTARVKTFGDVLTEYEHHPEAKCADSDGNACDKQTVGLMQRRHIRIDYLKYIGKESNNLEEVEAGLIHDDKNAYTEYEDRRRDEWQTKILPQLRRLSPGVLRRFIRLSDSTLNEILAGRSRPHAANRKRLIEMLRELGQV